MMKIAALAAFTGAAHGFMLPAAPLGKSGLRMAFTQDDLKELAKSQNPVIGFFDPLTLSEQRFWEAKYEESTTEAEINEATIGFLRHAEMKHGRVAMAGFVGYCVHAQGITFPGTMTLDGRSFAEIAATADGNPALLWDNIPELAKYQIIGLAFFVELLSETNVLLELNGEKHYMRGGKPGYLPPFNVPDDRPGKEGKKNGYPLSLFDPFGFTKKLSEEEKARKLNIEINNGRLAMIGLFSFFAASKVPGSVPALQGKIKPYDGDYMAPFYVEPGYSLFAPTVKATANAVATAAEGVAAVAEQAADAAAEVAQAM